MCCCVLLNQNASNANIFLKSSFMLAIGYTLDTFLQGGFF